MFIICICWCDASSFLNVAAAAWGCCRAPSPPVMLHITRPAALTGWLLSAASCGALFFCGTAAETVEACFACVMLRCSAAASIIDALLIKLVAPTYLRVEEDPLVPLRITLDDMPLTASAAERPMEVRTTLPL